MTTYYVVMKLAEWRSQCWKDGSTGYLPVFTSREAAEAAYPGAEVLVMREREEVTG